MNLTTKSKKLSVALVVGLIFLLLFSQSAFAAEGVKLSASSTSGVAGDDVTVTINIANAKDSEGGQFDLSFDPEILEPKSATRGDFVPDVSGNLFDSNLNLEAGKLRLLWVIAEGSEKESGVVGTIVFKMLKDGETDLVFSNMVMAADDSEAETPTDGKVTVIDEATAKANAINAADDAIAALPKCDEVTLDDKADVEAARALVNKAIDDFEAEAADFADLDKLSCAEGMIAKLEAIKAADDAILALPSVDALKLDDKADVEAARALVNKAKSDHKAQDSDFIYLTRLVAAENRIKELEGQKPTPPTGGMTYIFLAGGLILIIGLLGLLNRERLSAR